MNQSERVQVTTLLEGRPVGFIGLGNMGFGMAGRLLDCGWSVMVYDTRPEPLAALAGVGAQVAADLDELTETCAVISTMVYNDEQVLSLFLGPDPLISRCTKNHLLIVHSTVEPQTILRIGEEAAHFGVTVLDVPVSGGLANEQRLGQLVMLAGGEPAQIDRCEPLLRTLGKQVYRVGPLGSGAATKLANNVMAIGNMIFMFEGTRLGEAYGVDPKKLLTIVAEGGGQSYSADHTAGFLELWRERNRLAGPDDDKFTKDLWHAVRAAEAKGIDLPLVNHGLALGVDLARKWAEDVGGKLD